MTPTCHDVLGAILARQPLAAPLVAQALDHLRGCRGCSALLAQLGVAHLLESIPGAVAEVRLPECGTVDVDDLLRTALSRSPEELGPPGPDCLDPAALAQAHQATAHLHGCARCARAFLDIDVPPPASPEDDAFDVAAGWRRLQSSKPQE